MQIINNSNLNDYYIQMMCMLFFPGEKFSPEEINDQRRVGVDIDYIDNSIKSTVTITYDQVSQTSSVIEQINSNIPIEKCIKKVVSKAFLSSAKKLTHKDTPWGILTGVRPAKVVLNEYSQLNNFEKVKEVLVDDFYVNEQRADLAVKIAKVEKDIIDSTEENTCSIYVSIPFCPSRCNYCSFVSLSTQKLFSLLDDYINSLCEDIIKQSKIINELGLKILTIYIGGGTPTVLSESQLDKLLSTISSSFDLSSLKEYTIEAGRPDTFTIDKLKTIKKHGITRVCINTQTLNDSILEGIGRKHTSRDYYKAIKMAQEVGFDQINTDLIAGLPNETVESFKSNIDNIIDLGINNITVHTLCIKNAADFSNQKVDLINESTNVIDMVNYAHEKLQSSNYIPYYIYRQKNTLNNLENTGYSTKGNECLYNIYMMEEIHSIFSFGAGAVTKLVSRNKKDIQRIFEFKYPYEFLSERRNQKEESKVSEIINFFKTKY